MNFPHDEPAVDARGIVKFSNPDVVAREEGCASRAPAGFSGNSRREKAAPTPGHEPGRRLINFGGKQFCLLDRQHVPRIGGGAEPVLERAPGGDVERSNLELDALGAPARHALPPRPVRQRPNRLLPCAA